MDSAEQILVIILSSVLAVFLVLGIILVVKLIQLANKMQEIADTAREVAGNVEAAADMLRKTAGPLALGKFFVNIAETVMKHKKGK